MVPIRCVNSPRRHNIAMIGNWSYCIDRVYDSYADKDGNPETKGSDDRGDYSVEAGRTGIKQEEMKRIEPVAPPPPALKSSIKFTAPVIKKDEE